MRNVVHAARFLILGVLLATGLPLRRGAGAGPGDARHHHARRRLSRLRLRDRQGRRSQRLPGGLHRRRPVPCLHLSTTRPAGASSRPTSASSTATPGATAGRLVQTVELTPSLEATRLARARLHPGQLHRRGRASSPARSSAAIFPPTGAAYQALRDRGHRGLQQPATTTARPSLFGQALSLADDNPGLWLDFAIASLGRNPDDWTERQRAYTDITAAGINAFVRSETPDNQAKALALMGDGFAAARGVEAVLPLLSRQPRAGR